MIRFSMLYRRTLSTVPHQFRIGWGSALVIISVAVPQFLSDPYASSLLLVSLGALFAVTIWNTSPTDAMHKLWLAAGTSKSALIGARLLTVLTYAAPWGLGAAAISKLGEYPASSIGLLLLSHLTAICFLTTVGLAASLGWGRQTGPALILGFLVLGLVLNPIWQQRVRWVMPSLVFFHPGLPDPVNLIGLAGVAIVVTAIAVFWVGRGETRDKLPKALLTMMAVAVLATAVLVDIADRKRLTMSPFQSYGDDMLTVQYRGLPLAEAIGLHHLAQCVEEMLRTDYGMSFPTITLTAYRSRNLRFEDDPGLPGGDHAYKLRYNGQRSLRFGARYNWPARLTRDLFRDSWRQFPLTPGALHLVDAWGEALAERVVGPAAAGSGKTEAGPGEGIGRGLADLRQLADRSYPLPTEVAAQLFLFRVLDHEGPALLGRAQEHLVPVPEAVTPTDLYEAMRIAAADPAFVDQAWGDLLASSSTTD